MKKLKIKEKKIKSPKTKITFRFRARVVKWSPHGSKTGEDKGAWRFAYLSKEISQKIKKIQEGKRKRGWGAVYVDAKVGRTVWLTSIFPDKRSDTYLLPLKKEVRYEENLYDNKEFLFRIEIKL